MNGDGVHVHILGLECQKRTGVVHALYAHTNFSVFYAIHDEVGHMMRSEGGVSLDWGVYRRLGIPPVLWIDDRFP